MSRSISFLTADEAAIDALDGILPKSMSRLHEYAGYIFQIGSGQQAKFFYNSPLEMSSDPRGGTVSPPLIIAGAKVVATMHTHPFNEETWGEPNVISTLVKPPRFSPVDVQGRRDFEATMQQRGSPGPIDMYVIDIRKEITVLEGKRGTQPERERTVRPCGDLTCI